MYLYVWPSGPKVVRDNPTVGDIVSANMGLLTIIRIRVGGFERLTSDGWVTVPDAGVVFCEEARFHT